MSPEPIDAATIAADVQSGRRTARAVAEASLARIATTEPAIHAFLGVTADRALAAADAIDDRRANGEPLGPLAGVPIAWKDNLVCAGEIATAGSRLLEPFRAPYSATVLERLEAAGAVLIGRTNLDEFGMGSTTENSAFGPTRNPVDPTLVPGGSSGGSAAAVAALDCPLAIGTDTGGSVRQPAAFCGVTGIKPTYGRVSRYGLIAYASSLDCVGAIARNAADLRLWLRAVEGPDPADATSLRRGEAKPETADVPRDDLTGLRVGLPWQLNGPGIDEEVSAAVRTAATELERLGATVEECSLAAVAHAVPTYYLVATAEASSNLARYDGVRYGQRRDGRRLEAMMAATRSHGFGHEVQLRVLLGTFALRAGYHEELYGRATRIRDLLRREFETAFASYDVLLSPTSPVPPFPLGSRLDDPLAMYLCDALTVPANLAGIPALSLPCGSTATGRPIGLQCMAAHGNDDALLRVGELFQRQTDHHRRTADLAGDVDGAVDGNPPEAPTA
ncbi:MAG: Asp-tRNA(Asn)/Glu-tRNA(Gln) amidotransferase subunit GatA [bacterium]|nr:Asp-tRNA(Asn)/Glu-tRNA(Gln) amidotransferase subunit GatA [bacterium]